MPKSRDYVRHGTKIFLLKSAGNTNVRDAAEKAYALKPERTLIALITDGLVSRNDLEYLAGHDGVNKVIAAVVDASKEGVETVKAVGDKIQLYIVKPDSAGRTVISLLR